MHCQMYPIFKGIHTAFFSGCVCVEPTSNEIVPWLPYFLTKWDKKRFVDRLNGTVGLDVDVDADVGVNDDDAPAAAAVVCSAKTVDSDSKCAIKTIGKANFNKNVNVILCDCWIFYYIFWRKTKINNSACEAETSQVKLACIEFNFIAADVCSSSPFQLFAFFVLLQYTGVGAAIIVFLKKNWCAHWWFFKMNFFLFLCCHFILSMVEIVSVSICVFIHKLIFVTCASSRSTLIVVFVCMLVRSFIVFSAQRNNIHNYFLFKSCVLIVSCIRITFMYFCAFLCSILILIRSSIRTCVCCRLDWMN